MAATGARPAPITVYRALDFLLAHGLVHKIESRNAFIACSHPHDGEPAALLICENCGMVAELDAPRRVRRRLSAQGRGAGLRAARASSIDGAAAIAAHCA